jgi:hypothetical protein
MDMVPVDHDPFAAGPKTEPVDYDPFASEKFLPQGAADWTKRAARKDVSILRETTSLPQRAFQSSETMRQGGVYDPGPIMEAAALPMAGGIGGVERGAVFGSGPPRLKNFFAGESLKDVGETAEQIWQQNKGKMRGVNEHLGRLRTMGVARGDWTAEEVAEIEAAIKEKAKSPFVDQAKLDRDSEKALDKRERNVGFKPVDHDPFGDQ